MTSAYATEAELADWLPGGTVVDDAARLLKRASEVIDAHLTAAFLVDDDTGLPTDSTVAASVRDACCAQVEYWLEVGEEHDVAGMAGRRVGIGQLSVDRLPPVLAPRAARIVGNAGLFDPSVAGWPT